LFSRFNGFALLRLDQVDVYYLIPVTNKHHPLVEKKIVVELFQIDQEWGQAQFL